MSGGFDGMEDYDILFANPSLAALSEEQRRQEMERQQQERRDAATCVLRNAKRQRWVSERTLEILQALGLVGYDTSERTFPCGCSQSEDNTIPSSKAGGTPRCRLHTNGRAQLRYPRNKAGAV